MTDQEKDYSADTDWLSTPPDSQISPPTVTRVQELDFGALSWENFEKLCFRLAAFEADVEHCQLYGVRGQSQKGIDIYARKKSDNSFAVYQCKRENKFTAGKIKAAVDKFLIGKWAKEADQFVLCTKESLIETQLADEIEKQSKILKKKKISLVIWGSVQLSDKLKNLPDLVDQFFGREWVRVFCGEEAYAQLGEKFDQAIFDNYIAAIQRFSSDTPYLALNETLTGKKLSLNEIYVPLPFSASEFSGSKNKTPAADESAGETSNTEKISSSLTFADVLSYAVDNQNPVLLLGAGGAGKSTALYRFAHNAWDNPSAAGLSERYLPIFIRLPVLATVREISVSGLLLESLRMGGDLTLTESLPENFFDSWSRKLNAKWLVMLDGLDEVAAERWAETLQRLKHLVSVLTDNEHLVVMTSRPANEEEFRRLSESSVVADLLPFNETQRRDFATRWFGSRADDFLEKARKFRDAGNLFREPLVLTPLLLTIAAAVYETQGDLPEAGKDELYREFIDVLFAKAEQRGLREDLRDEVFDVARIALEELALAMTDRPEENSLPDLEKVCAGFLRQTLGYNAARAQRPARDLCEVLTRRSGVLFRQGEVCQWVHATMREYLAAVALDRRIKDGESYDEALGARIHEDKNDELLVSFGRIHENKRGLILWLTEKAKENKSAKMAVFAYDFWSECSQDVCDKLTTQIIPALACGLGDEDSERHLLDVSKKLLIEIGEPAVESLLCLLGELNCLQEKLLPEWNDSNSRPDVDDDPGREIHRAYITRLKIIEILGEIGDERAIGSLILLLPQKSKFDSYRYYISQEVRRALKCIGAPALAPIIEFIENSANSVADRCHYFAGLTAIGIRNAEVSEIIGKCLAEGLEGNEELLKFAVWAAASLGDRSQANLVEQALASSDLDTLDRAALYFTLMPDESAVSALETAFQNCLSRPEDKPFWSSLTIQELAAALLASGQNQTRNFVLEFIKNNLAGNDKIQAFTVIEILGASDLPEAPEILLRELARLNQKSAERSDGVIDRLIREIVKIWRAEDLERLAFVANQLLNEAGAEKSFVDNLIEIQTNPLQPMQVDQIPLSTLVSFDEILKTLANCRVPDFGAKASKLLSVSSWSSTMSICDALWLAEDPAAETALIDKLRELTTIRKAKEKTTDHDHPGTDEYYVLRALGTCAVSRSAVETVLDYICEDPRLNINLPSEVLRTMLRRGVVTPERITEIALNRTRIHEYARNFCLQALGSLNAPMYASVFLDAFKNETCRENKAYAAHALGWAHESYRDQAITALEKELTETGSSYIASNTGRSLVRLKSSGSLPLIEAAVRRFGSDNTLELLVSASQFGACSTFELLPDISRDKLLYSGRKAQIISAYNFYYGTEEQARNRVRAWFEYSIKGQEMGLQRHAARLLAKHDPVWLLENAARLFDEGLLEPNASLDIISRARQLSEHELVDAEKFVRLFVRFLCARDLTVREAAAESMAVIGSALREKIYAVLYAQNDDWARACAIYSFGFWDSDIAEIERALFDSSKVVRHLAETAKTLREKRAALEETIQTFKESGGGSERVAAYFVLAEHAQNSDVETLYITINYEHPSFLFLDELEKDIEKRVENERKKRADDEKKAFCRRAPFTAFSFS